MSSVRIYGFRSRADEEQKQRLAQAVLLLHGVPKVSGFDQLERRTRWRYILPIVLWQILRTEGRGLRNRSWHTDNGLNFRPKKRVQGLHPIMQKLQNAS